jgi:hypothetical protein
MKTMAAIIASLLLSVITFTVGVVGTIFYLSTSERASISTTTEMPDLWTTEPTVVARNQDRLESVAARPTSVFDPGSATRAVEIAEQKIQRDDGTDSFVTGSIADQESQSATTLSREHVDWCMSRYNSYRVDDGTYQPYNGKRRPCISPYITVESEMPIEEDGAAEEILLGAQRAFGDTGVSVTEVAADIDHHVHRCSKRYRSYRPEDNTYQPFDGGPRRQCR